MAKIIIFTDLDGTLLHPKTYSFEEARSALKLIREKGIPLLLCSSKTRAEMEVYRKRLENGHPFISENGGGIKEFVEEMAEALQYEHISTKEAVFKYLLNAMIIVGAATWLPFIGDRLAEETGLGRSFIGSIFIAMTTSLPELVVSISALKIGATDMAIANLFGSNMFNISILAIDDNIYRPLRLASVFKDLLF